MRTAYREDTGWSPEGGTTSFVTPPNAYLEYLEVLKSQCGKGIGSGLLALLEEGMRSVGWSQLWLHTSVSNEGAQRLYDRLGWTYEETIYSGLVRRPIQTRIYAKQLDYEHKKTSLASLILRNVGEVVRIVSDGRPAVVNVIKRPVAVGHTEHDLE